MPQHPYTISMPGEPSPERPAFARATIGGSAMQPLRSRTVEETWRDVALVLERLVAEHPDAF